MIFSEKIKNILRAMESNSIANLVLSSTQDTPYDYIDITKDNDTIGFISSAKRDELLSKVEVKYTVVDDTKYLSHSEANKGLFKKLGYEAVGDRPERARVGTIGNIVKETVSKKTGNTFCLFEYFSDGRGHYESPYEGWDAHRSIFDELHSARQAYRSREEVKRPTKKLAINKAYLRPNQSDTSFLWTKNRNNIKVGRLVRSLLMHLSVEFTDKSIEDFVNLFKSTYDLEQNALKKFSLIKSKDISKWYDKDNYIKGCTGQLYNSCMKGVPSRYFKLYKDNDVKLLVQFTDGGKLVKDKYTSETIKGRALVWEGVDIDGVGKATLVDRIYTHNDSDVELFREYAKMNGWYWKDRNGYFTNGSVVIQNNRVSYQLKKSNFRNYPYVDTFRYLDTTDNIIHTGHLKYDATLGRTDGRLNNR